MKKIFVLVVSLMFLLSACSTKSNDSKILENAKSIINKDLSDDISVNECLYNEDANAVYLKFYSFEHGNDEAIIFLDDNLVFYESIYSTIAEDDYEQQIEYGDFAIMMYQIIVNGASENWATIDISE